MGEDDREFRARQAFHHAQKDREDQATPGSADPKFDNYGGTGAGLAIEGCFERIVGGLIVWGGLILVIIAAWQDPSNQGKVCLAMVFGPLLIYFAFRVRRGINRKPSA